VGVSLTKIAPEGVRGALGRQSRDGQPRLEEGKGKGGGGGRNRAKAAARHGLRPKLAGVERPGAMVLGFPLREHREKERMKTSLSKAFARPGRRPRGTLHGRRPWSSPEHAANTDERFDSREKRSRMKRRKRETHQREEVGEKGLARPDCARRIAASQWRPSLRLLRTR